jgi:REP element-mobilizing transposase RayT
MRLVPTDERVQINGYCLAKAQEKSPDLDLLAICQMSNHEHIEALDKAGCLSSFMRDYVGSLATQLNQLDQIQGTVFERRFTSIPIVDEDALVDRVAYAINNPVKASLVTTHREWPGICLYATTEPQEHTFTVFRARDYAAAVEAAGADDDKPEPNIDDYYKSATLKIPAVSAELAAKIEAGIRARETKLRQKQGKVAGIAKVVAVSPFARPKFSKRSRMPDVFASTGELRRAFRDGWRRFVGLYRMASEAFRNGILDTPFPAWSHRPPTAVRG